MGDTVWHAAACHGTRRSGPVTWVTNRSSATVRPETWAYRIDAVQSVTRVDCRSLSSIARIRATAPRALPPHRTRGAAWIRAAVQHAVRAIRDDRADAARPHGEIRQPLHAMAA